MNSQDKIAKIPEVIAYARVSSREQAENSAALDQQIARLKAAGAEIETMSLKFAQFKEPTIAYL